MKYPFNILALLFLCPLMLLAQDVAYYKQVADTTTDTGLKLVALDSVISKSFRKDDDTFVEYSLQYIDLAKEVDSIHGAAKKAMNLQFIITSRKNMPEKAVTVINGVLAHKYKIQDSFLIAGLYLKRGRAKFRLDLKEAIDDYTLALENFGENDSVYVADAYLFRGQAYSNLGMFVPAGDSYQQAYDYYEALQDYEYMVHAQQGITTMFSMNGFYEKAKEEREKIIEKLEDLGLENFLVVEYYNQSLDYRKMGKDSLHFEYLMKAVDILNNTSEENNSIYESILVHSQLAEYYSDAGDLENAEAEIELVGEWIKQANDFNSQISYSGALAHYYFAKRDFDEALVHAKEKLAVSKAYKYTDAILDSHQLLGRIYGGMGDYNNSLENNEAYIAMKDSIYNRSTANSLAYYQTLYETEKKEKELFEQRANIQLLEKDNEAFKKVLIFWIVALLLFFGLILLFRNQKHLKNKKELQEQFSQDLLVSQEEERMRISKDLHDGLGQRLLLIKNKLIDSGDQDTKSMVDETIEEVRAISRVLHPFQLQELGITKAIKYTLDQIDENTTLFISSEIDNIDNIFTQEQEVNIYRIIQESLSNVLKHAKAEASKVTVKKDPDQVTIAVKDNGVGFDFLEKYEAVKSLGLKTMMERTKFLNGQMKVQSISKNGTLIEFILPIV